MSQIKTLISFDQFVIMVDHELNSFVDQFDDLTIQEIKDHEYYTIEYLKEGFEIMELVN